jgi:YaiO family outer membrane protein
MCKTSTAPLGRPVVRKSQSRNRAGTLLAAAIVLLVGQTAFAQDDLIARARTAFSSGRSDDAFVMLEERLAEVPRDVDVRLTYGLLLSWEHRYDEAREQLRRVLALAPRYQDAQVALMNVEWWSGHRDEARDLSMEILSSDPGNPQARLIRQRLDASSKRPWTVTTWYTNDTFNEGDPWHEFALSLGRETPFGTVLLRGTEARRFGYGDQLIEVEAYPTFRAGTYAFVGVGAGTGGALFPTYRTAFDLYQNVGHGLEVSGGYRRLQFADPVSIYVATATQYVGQWSVLGRVYFVPSNQSDSWSFHAESRRYLGGGGTSFIGLTVSQGFSRDEPRTVGDASTLHSNTVKGQADVEVSPRTRLLVTLSGTREERALRVPLWQTTLSIGAAYRF